MRPTAVSTLDHRGIFAIWSASEVRSVSGGDKGDILSKRPWVGTYMQDHQAGGCSCRCKEFVS